MFAYRVHQGLVSFANHHPLRVAVCLPEFWQMDCSWVHRPCTRLDSVQPPDACLNHHYSVSRSYHPAVKQELMNHLRIVFGWQ